MAQEVLRVTDFRNLGRNCALCDKILALRTRSHQVISLRKDTKHHENIRNIVLKKLAPLEVHESHFICHPCWQKVDRAATARHNSKPPSSRTSSKKNNNLRCVNCGINLMRQKRHLLYNNAILSQVQQRTATVVTADDYICDACHKLFLPSCVARTSQDATIGHQHICIGCGFSVAQTQRYRLGEASNHYILDVVKNWIQPKEVQPDNMLCHRCFKRADSATCNAILPKPEDSLIPQQLQKINLPNYIRASDTHRRCIFAQCNPTSFKLVPFGLRVRLIKDYNYYIPPGCRICEFHLTRQPWPELLEVENVNNSFTANHIEDLCELLKNDEYDIIDVKNLRRMDDNLVWYWLGITKDQFRELEMEFTDLPKRALSLAAYIMKLRTGDSDDRLSKLFNVSRSILTTCITNAQNRMVEQIVPLQLRVKPLNKRASCLTPVEISK